MSNGDYRAAILDLDGVLTRTATQHARAWKVTFDDFFEQRSAREGEDHSPFDIQEDYPRHVDGRPRYDGVRGFLRSRGIVLPEGGADGGPDEETVRGLGDRKNEIFLGLLDREPVERYEDAVEQVQRWRDEGLATALITSSRNGRRILQAAGLEDLFDVTVDGVDSERLGIRGKPAPDIFLHAARELGVEPADAIVVEDAISGVEAGRAGGFGLVVGVARGGGDRLRQAGAHRVVGDLRELGEGPDPGAGYTGAETESALAKLDRIMDRLAEGRLALFFDYDGTLTPIVRRPEDATLSEVMRSVLRELAKRVSVAIVSGRDLSDVRKMVGLDELYYAGSHGFDVAGPNGMRMQQEQALDRLPELDHAERELGERLKAIEGAWVERKRFAIAIHYREAEETDAERIEAAVDEVLGAHPRLRKKGGKKIFEIQPDVDWDKGRAVRWLLERLDLDGPDVLAVYVGDDTTDEDAFEALTGRGVGIRVGPPDEPTSADLHLRDPEELERFARELLRRLDRRAANRA